MSNLLAYLDHIGPRVILLGHTLQKCPTHGPQVIRAHIRVFLCYRNTRAACGPQTAGWITLEDKCQGSTHSEPSSDSWGGEEPVKSSGTVSACLFLSIRPFQGCIQKNLGLTWIPLLRAGNRQTYHLQEQGHRRGSCLHWRYFHLEDKKWKSTGLLLHSGNQEYIRKEHPALLPCPGNTHPSFFFFFFFHQQRKKP